MNSTDDGNSYATEEQITCYNIYNISIYSNICTNHYLGCM